MVHDMRAGEGTVTSALAAGFPAAALVGAAIR
jgi:hypothetical protein